MNSINELALRRIPFSSLKSSTEAFIDYCLPECRPKFNYAMIGSGVSQNPNQPVNIREPHGFQLGGVSIPHGKVNPAHMHFTCEVFLCFKGNWLIQWGFNPSCESAEIGELDIVSIPTWIYRGFKNIGVDDGFLFTALGGDKTGGVLWGPTTVAAAQNNGVYLTKNHQMIDTTRGESKPPEQELFEPMSAAEIDKLKKWSVAEMSSRIVRFNELQWSTAGLLDSSLPGCGAQVAPVVGLGMSEEINLQAKITTLMVCQLSGCASLLAAKYQNICLMKSKSLLSKNLKLKYTLKLQMAITSLQLLEVKLVGIHFLSPQNAGEFLKTWVLKRLS